MRPFWQTAPTRLLRVLLDPACFWSLLGTYEGEPIQFDPWQVAWLRNHNRYRATEKAPQIGWSWLCALEALHECLMFHDVTSTFVSVDQREATEKVLYARKAYTELPSFITDALPLSRDSTEEMWIGDAARPSRVMSLPATSALRGRRMSVYLDEADFYKDAGRDSFRVAMGRVARGGRVSMGSTCFGEGTQLDILCRRNTDLLEDVADARNFAVFRMPFTVVIKPEVVEAIHIAINELDPIDALEEYGTVRGGATGDTFTAGLIRRQQHDEPVFKGDTSHLRHDWETGNIAIMGYDVGKSRHPSVASVLEHHPDGVWRQTVCHEPRNDRGDPLTLPQQHDFLRDILHRVDSLVLVVDGNGIGAHIAQALVGEFGPRRIITMIANSKPDGLPPQTKPELVTELKRALEADEIQLAPDREQAEQFKRTKLPGGHIVEQKGSRRKVHFDRFWATTYAWYGTTAAQAVRSVYASRELIVIGGD